MIKQIVVIHTSGGRVTIDNPDVCEVKNENYLVGRYTDEEHSNYDINMFPLVNILHIIESYEWQIL